jgi:hypothetical protein
VSLAVRRVSLISDRAEMLDLWNRNFGAGQEMRFDWRHLRNPVGEAWAWFVYDQNNGTAVATTSVFPRRMFVAGKSVICGQVGGFAVEASHRSLGPAVLLQRTTFEPADSGQVAFVYDCPPHDRGMSTFARLGIRPNCEMTRYALPLRSNEFIERKVGSGPWTKPIVATANLLLRMRQVKRQASRLEIAEFGAKFGDEFSYLDRLVSSAGVIRASRTSEILNWRYREDPASEARVLTARRAGELVGFLVLLVSECKAYILDLFGLELAPTGAALLDAAVEVCRRENLFSLHGSCSEQSELRSLLMRAGFRPRERDERVVAYEKPGDKGAPLLNPGVRWAFSRAEVIV